MRVNIRRNIQGTLIGERKQVSDWGPRNMDDGRLRSSTNGPRYIRVTIRK